MRYWELFFGINGREGCACLEGKAYFYVSNLGTVDRALDRHGYWRKSIKSRPEKRNAITLPSTDTAGWQDGAGNNFAAISNPGKRLHEKIQQQKRTRESCGRKEVSRASVEPTWCPGHVEKYVGGDGSWLRRELCSAIGNGWKARETRFNSWCFLFLPPIMTWTGTTRSQTEFSKKWQNSKHCFPIIYSVWNAEHESVTRLLNSL